MKNLLVLLIIAFSGPLFAQSVGIGTDTPDESAALEISSTSQGVLVPRMTSEQRTSITSPAQGLLVFDVTTSTFWFNGSSSWVELVDSSNIPIHKNGTDIYMGMDGKVGIGTSTPDTKLTVETTEGTLGISHKSGGSLLMATKISSGIGGSFGTITPNPFNIITNDIIRATVTPDGDVGIGTSTPDTKLAIETSDGSLGISHKSGGSLMATKVSATNGGSFGTITPNPFNIITNDTIRTTITPAGDLGIGTSTPETKLAVETSDGSLGISHKSGGLLMATKVSVTDGGSFGTTTPNPFNIITNDMIRTTVTPAGNVGIGTSTPGTKLAVKTDDESYGFAHENEDVKLSTYVSSTSGGWFGTVTNHPLKFYTNDGTDQLTLATNGNTGIGESNPQQKLHVQGNVLVTSKLGIGEPSPGFPLNFPSTTGDKISLYGTNGEHYGFGVTPNLLQIHSNTPESNIAFGYGSSAIFTERMRLTGAGDLGIGTTSPQQKLHVEGNTYINGKIGIGTANPVEKLHVQTPTASYGIAHGDGTVKLSTYVNSAQGGYFGTVTNHPLKFFANNLVKATVLPNGNVGIGTENPSSLLSVADKFLVNGSGEVQYKSDVANMMYMYEGVSGLNKMILAHSTSFPAWGLQYEGATNKFKFKSADATTLTADVQNVRVGIGTDTPSEMLDVAGNAKIDGTLAIGYEIAHVAVGIVGFATQNVFCNCPPGKKVLGGGWADGSGSFAVGTSAPFDSDTWLVKATNVTPAADGIDVYAICIRVTE